MSQDQPPTSVWTRPRKGRSTLHREDIVDAALRLLDSEGLGALTMRRLGTELGAGATSLYWHVANRDELLALVIDQVYGQLDVPDPDAPDGWRAAAHRFAHSLRSTILQHSWIAVAPEHMASAFMGPNFVDRTERLLALFENAGFAQRETDQALNTLCAYALGVTLPEAMLIVSLSGSGRDAEDWLDERIQIAEQMTTDHPRLRAAFLDLRDSDAATINESDFEYGLERVLDGLDVRLEQIGSPKRQSSKRRPSRRPPTKRPPTKRATARN